MSKYLTNYSDPYIYEETHSENRVYSIQINQLRLAVSMQKWVWKICTESQDIGQNM